ncbi:CAP domain-containing protein [Patescibacteria group bacterium]
MAKTKTKINNTIFKSNNASNICKAGLFFLFFLMPFIVYATPISKDSLIQLTNEQRQLNNFAVLRENSVLNNVGINKAKDILDKQYFAHTNPDGKPFYKWIDESGYNYIYAGENLAINFTESEDAVKAWMDSKLHRENILNPNYEEIGIGIMSGSFKNNFSIVVAQIFGKPFLKINRVNPESLEKSTYNTLIEGITNKKPIMAINSGDSFNSNNNLLMDEEMFKLPEIYPLNDSYLTTPITPETIIPETNEDKNKIYMPLSSNSDITDKITSFNSVFSAFDILTLIMICIILISIYGSAVEKIKESLFRDKKQHSHI